jgi:hypothetical protein
MSKSILILLSIVLILITADSIFNAWIRQELSVKAINAGLEECPVPHSAKMTVWVKSCADFTKMYLDSGERKVRVIAEEKRKMEEAKRNK